MKKKTVDPKAVGEYQLTRTAWLCQRCGPRFTENPKHRRGMGCEHHAFALGGVLIRHVPKNSLKTVLKIFEEVRP